MTNGEALVERGGNALESGVRASNGSAWWDGKLEQGRLSRPEELKFSDRGLYCALQRAEGGGEGWVPLSAQIRRREDQDLIGRERELSVDEVHRVSFVKLNRQAGIRRASPRFADHRGTVVDAYDSALRSDKACDFARIVPGPASNIEHSFSRSARPRA